MRRKKPSINRRYLLVGIAALILVMFAVSELTNTTHLLHKEKVPPVIPARDNSGTTINSPGSSSDSNSSGSSSNPGDTSDTTPDTTDHTLVAPTGNFVSNHFPGENGSPTSESSTCNTSPGASCYIKFTNLDSGATTQLPVQTVDGRGSTSWYWDVKDDAHLTSGRWKITAVATLGDQSKSTDDALRLTIQ